jgi:hypothetical protein
MNLFIDVSFQSVHSNSPAEKAGLKAQEGKQAKTMQHPFSNLFVDYIVASPDFVIRSESDFYELITQNMKKPVKMIVFNSESESIRQIEIVPDFEWGGEGCVGCDIGTGMLHWIPVDDLKSAPAPALAPPMPNPIISASPIAKAASLVAPQIHLQQSNIVQPQILPEIQSSCQAPQIQSLQPIAVSAPTNRPVFDSLSTSSAFAPVQQAPIPPHPPQQLPQKSSPSNRPIISTAEFVFDDIPKPNFTVSSDMFNSPQ